MSRGLPAFAALFSPAQKRQIDQAPMYWGRRHPIWVPLFGEGESLHAGYRRLDQSVKLISLRPDGASWLTTKIPKLLDEKEVNNASAAMAEIRTFGGLIAAGFEVDPVLETDDTTPDFKVSTGNQTVVVEVAAKHQDREQDKLQAGIYDATRGLAPVPQGVEYSQHRVGERLIRMTVSVHQPAGRPDPLKPGDSVQANLISRVCAIKGEEHQFPADMAGLLVVDFNDFGGPLTPLTLGDQSAPAMRWTDGFTSGALWYAFYGWKGAPVFEGDERVKMGHDGRFRMRGERQSRLSAVLLVMPKHVVCFEHPWAAFRLAEDTRLALARYPWFDLSRSVLEWTPGDVERRVELDRAMIKRLDARFDDIRRG